MLQTLRVANFRSIEEAQVDFAPITVLYGPTASGKSSLFYSLLVLRNLLLSPAQSADKLFDLGTFQSLGGFEACIFNHETSQQISVEAEFAGRDDNSSYGMRLRKADCDVAARSGSATLEATFGLPYAANQSWQYDLALGDVEYVVTWNGFAATAAPKEDTADNRGKSRLFAEKLNSAAEALRTSIDICPHIRGFSKPVYTPVAPSLTPTDEMEVASLIINDQYAAGRISAAAYEIFGREFRTYQTPGTSATSFQTTEIAQARVPGLLVNDGFGVNQVIYMLAKILRRGIQTTLIEEPEVHLHPVVIRKLAQFMTRIAREDRKQLIMTTHSAQLLLSLLACVRAGQIPAEEIACYYVDREGRRSIFKREPVTSDGQVSDGLSSFMEPELEDIQSLFSKRK